MARSGETIRFVSRCIARSPGPVRRASTSRGASGASGWLRHRRAGRSRRPSAPLLRHPARRSPLPGPSRRGPAPCRGRPAGRPPSDRGPRAAAARTRSPSGQRGATASRRPRLRRRDGIRRIGAGCLRRRPCGLGKPHWLRKRGPTKRAPIGPRIASVPLTMGTDRIDASAPSSGETHGRQILTMRSGDSAAPTHRQGRASIRRRRRPCRSNIWPVNYMNGNDRADRL